MSHREKVDEATNDLDFENKNYQVQLDTNKGMVKLNLDTKSAPNHCRNMIGLARTGFYDGLIFHRIISGFMIQGGCPEGSGTGGPGYKVDAEFNKTAHEEGVLSMARSQDPNSAGSQFFVCLGTHAYLDGQYTAFGKTADDDSLKVVREIGGVATDSGDRPNEEIKINKVTVEEI